MVVHRRPDGTCMGAGAGVPGCGGSRIVAGVDWEGMRRSVPGERDGCAPGSRAMNRITRTLLVPFVAMSLAAALPIAAQSPAPAPGGAPAQGGGAAAPAMPQEKL